MKKCLFAGTFDPPTLGHKDIVMKCLALFDEVIVAILINPNKKPLFSVEERLVMLKKVFAAYPNVRVLSYDGLTVDLLKREGVRFYVRGIRNGTDYDYEAQLNYINVDMYKDMITVFLPTRQEFLHISSGLVKDALRYLKPARRKHSLRVALTAAQEAAKYRLDEHAVIQAAALHDAAKNLDLSAPELAGFIPPEENIPAPVLHQYTGAYLAEHTFGVTDAAVLDAIRYHTSGRPNMGELEKLIFLSDMLEPGRDFPHIGKLREVFRRSLNECMYLSLRHELKYLKKGGGEIYPLTFRAYEYYKGLRS